MTKREQAIEAASSSIDQMLYDNTWDCSEDVATAAFDAILKVIAEPDAEMVEAGARAALKSELSPRRDPELAWENEKDAWLHNIAAAHPAIIRKLMGGGE